MLNALVQFFPDKVQEDGMAGNPSEGFGILENPLTWGPESRTTGRALVLHAPDSVSSSTSHMVSRAHQE